MDVSRELAASMNPGYADTRINIVFDICDVPRVGIPQGFGPQRDAGKLTPVRVKIEHTFIWYKLNTRLEINSLLSKQSSVDE